MLKRDIRKEYLATRLKMEYPELVTLSLGMVEVFRQYPIPKIQNYLTYFPLTERNEFNITLCEKLIHDQFPEAVCSWPALISDEPLMEARTAENKNNFTRNQYNIPEPFNGRLVDSKDLDLVFVPLLAFDHKGYRVGYGKGYYDRYLQTCRPDVLKIGFSFFDPVEHIDDLDEFDVPLNLCITPTREYEF